VGGAALSAGSLSEGKRCCTHRLHAQSMRRRRAARQGAERQMWCWMLKGAAGLQRCVDEELHLPILTLLDVLVALLS
jgi:hypothetical protein